jgi:DNA-binding transcriptional MerR regulator
MASSGKKGYKIGEVCRIAEVQPYVLRYWETEFEQLAPGKTGGGQRQYTQEEIDVVLRIKELLYAEGFTIAGAKKKLESEIRDGRMPAKGEPASEGEDRRRALIAEARRELRDLLDLLGPE